MDKIKFFAALSVAVGLWSSALVTKANPELQRIESAFLPKREVGQPEFLKENPESDGRGVVMAIFDTGVDPAAAGMAVTTTGERKVLDILDATGSGDVDTSHKVEPDEEGNLTALGGKKLILPEGLINPEGSYRVGLKRAADFFPPEVLERLRSHDGKILEAILSQEKAKRHSAEKQRDTSFKEKAPEDRNRMEQDQAAREEIRSALEDTLSQQIPEYYFDCVVWNDGDSWRVMIDTDRDGNLQDEKQLRPYPIAGEYGILDPVSNLTFGVQIYEEGNLLSIVTVNGTHGTHVASIAAAHDPENPDRDGIAPGAQIISIRIGDPRVGGSYGESERRAVAMAAKAGVDIVNASWGGSSVYQDGLDANSQTYDMLVEKYGIFTVVSAGNDGPALSTLGSAGGEARRVLGVGAYVSAEMGEVLYSTLEDNPEVSLHFSSRGPTKDGDWGVDITAPGAALASYSGESLQGFEMANGTSMSSPNAAGVAALVLSAAKQEGLQTDPARLRAAFMLGAVPVRNEDVTSAGSGLINAPAALAKLRSLQDEAAFGAFYDLAVSRGSFTPEEGRGLYVRETQPDKRLRVVVGVQPEWIEAVTATEKVDFQTTFTLDSSADWIETPRVFNLANAENHFIAHVSVPEGSGDFGRLYTAEIKAHIAGKKELGPVFSVPVTVVRGVNVPANPKEPFRLEFQLEPSKTERVFLNVPDGADQLHVKVRHTAEDPIARRYILHGYTLSSELPIYASGNPRHLRLDEGEEEFLSFPTMEGEVMELTVYQRWSSVGPSTLELELEWTGMGNNVGTVVFNKNAGWAPAPFRSLTDASMELNAEIDRAVNVYIPVKAEHIPFDERAELPASPAVPQPIRQEEIRQIFELTFEEEFIADILYPQNHDISDYYGGGFTEIHHESGELLFASTVWGENFVKFPKGKSTVIRTFNQVKGENLERTKEIPFLLQRKVASAVSLPVFANLRDRFAGSPTQRIEARAGSAGNLFLQDSGLATLAKMKPSADYFTGRLTFSREDGTELGSQPILYFAGTPTEEALEKDPTAKEAEDIRSASEKLADALVEKQLEFVQSNRAAEESQIREQAKQVLEALLEQRPKDPELFFEMALQVAMNAGLAGKWWKGPEVEETDLAQKEVVQEWLNEARSLADPEAVAIFLGTPPQPIPGDTGSRHSIERQKKEMEKARAILVKIAQLETDLVMRSEDIDAAWIALQEVSRWESTPGDTTKAMRMALYEAEELWGLALEHLNDQLKDDPFNQELLEQRIRYYKSLGLDRFAEFESRTIAIRKAMKASLDSILDN